MSLLFITAAAAAVFLLAYRFYGTFLANKVFRLDDARPTPAVRLQDGLDYEPVPASYLLGQHFSAIAAAGPKRMDRRMLFRRFGIGLTAAWCGLLLLVGSGAAAAAPILGSSPWTAPAHYGPRALLPTAHGGDASLAATHYRWRPTGVPLKRISIRRT